MNLLLWARHLAMTELYELPIKCTEFLQQKTIPGGVGGPPAVQTLGKPPANNGHILEKGSLPAALNYSKGNL